VTSLRERRSLPPDQIEGRSFEIIAGLLPDFDHSTAEWTIVRRIVHTTGDPTIAPLVKIHPSAVKSGVRALREGKPILTDVKMLAAGINRILAAKLGCEIVCGIDDPSVKALAGEMGITRSAAAMIRLRPRIPGAVVAIGNAPTALFSLLDSVDEGTGAPALIVGTPVGFVGAAESKVDLVEMASPCIPYITVEGTRGGSAIAVATINALLRLAATDWASPD
jgi:precorrin-8X/cobalt-precorrin-8 methylmutase